jgi:hypothetical protein
MHYIKTDTDLYNITMSFDDQPNREFLVSMNTRTANIKNMLVWNGVIQCPVDTFDLTRDGEIIDSMFLRAARDSTIHVKRKQMTITVVRFYDSQSYTIDVDSATTVGRVKQLLSIQTGLPVDRQRLVLHREHIDDMDRTIESLQLRDNDVIYLVPTMQGDIGDFSAGSLHIPVSIKQTHALILETQNTKTGYTIGKEMFHAEAEPVLSRTTMNDLIHYFVDVHVPSSDHDQKVRMNLETLKSMVRIDEYHKLCERFGGRIDEIILRRTHSSVHTIIPYHLDVAIRTLQIPLNQIGRDYTGGQTIFLLENGSVHTPTRAEGSSTVHNDHVVHGVTAIRFGVRYGLFILEKLRPSSSSPFSI